MAALDQTGFWNSAAGTKKFTHALDHARFTHAVSRNATGVDSSADDTARKKLVAGFKRILRPGGQLLISDQPSMTMNGNPARIARLRCENSA
jgi:hypothetical protein